MSDDLAGTAKVAGAIESEDPAFARRDAADIARAKAVFDADYASLQKYHEAMTSAASAAFERARNGAESVRNAAAAVGIIYAAVLGLAFSVDKPLPLRGLIPAFFLGLAIVLATAYTSFLLRNPDEGEWPIEGVDVRSDIRARTNAFIAWVTNAVLHKSFALRAAVISLGLGVAFLPVPFVAISSSTAPTRAEAGVSAWPSSPVDITDPELRKILFQAQVTEAAEIRKAELQATPGESLKDGPVRWIYGLALFGFIAVFLGSWWVGRARKGDAAGVVNPPAANAS